MENVNAPMSAEPTNPPSQRQGSMTGEEERERRASIQAIMRDPNLTPQERRKSIQSLMDGRRRSSTAGRGSGRASMGGGNAMAVAAALAAADFAGSSDEEEEDEEDFDVIEEDRIDPDVKLVKRRTSGLRGSSLFARNSTRKANGAGGKPGKRRSSLRDSLTMGFSKMGVKNPGSAVLVDPNALARKMEKARPPCSHYQRNCTIISPCCGLAFGCRICHDDSPVLPPPFLISGGQPPASDLAAAGPSASAQNHVCVPVTDGPVPSPASASASAAAVGDAPPSAPYNSRASELFSSPKKFTHRSASLPTDFSDEETHHNIDRFLIKEVICRECFTRQSSKTNKCIKCGLQFGAYHCSICNLWMSADEDPYHCTQCGFCRVGGRENFTHCDACGMCIDALLFEDHNCKSGKYMSNCPVCQEDLFSSRMASHEMPCGHAIHWHCFRELTTYDTRCPVCKKTAETHDQMIQTWSAMAMGIALQPVPDELARVVDIICNDCEEKSANHRWHFLGVQCRKCSSFNTSVERTVLIGQEAADFLAAQPDNKAASTIPPSQWEVGSNNSNVMAALMGNNGIVENARVNMNAGDDMDTEALHQSFTAEVFGIMNGSSSGSLFDDFDLNSMGRPVSRSMPSNQPFSNMDGNDLMDDEEMDDSDMRP